MNLSVPYFLKKCLLVINLYEYKCLLLDINLVLLLTKTTSTLGDPDVIYQLLIYVYTTFVLLECFYLGSH